MSKTDVVANNRSRAAQVNGWRALACLAVAAALWAAMRASRAEDPPSWHAVWADRLTPTLSFCAVLGLGLVSRLVTGRWQLALHARRVAIGWFAVSLLWVALRWLDYMFGVPYAAIVFRGYAPLLVLYILVLPWIDAAALARMPRRRSTLTRWALHMAAGAVVVGATATETYLDRDKAARPPYAPPPYLPWRAAVTPKDFTQAVQALRSSAEAATVEPRNLEDEE